MAPWECQAGNPTHVAPSSREIVRTDSVSKDTAPDVGTDFVSKDSSPDVRTDAVSKDGWPVVRTDGVSKDCWTDVSTVSVSKDNCLPIADGGGLGSTADWTAPRAAHDQFSVVRKKFQVWVREWGLVSRLQKHVSISSTASLLTDDETTAVRSALCAVFFNSKVLVVMFLCRRGSLSFCHCGVPLLNSPVTLILSYLQF